MNIIDIVFYIAGLLLCLQIIKLGVDAAVENYTGESK